MENSAFPGTVLAGLPANEYTYPGKVLTGTVVLGTVGKCLIGMDTSEDAVQTVAFVITGSWDTELKAALFFKVYNKQPQTPEHLEDDKVLLMLGRLKARIRGWMDSVFSEASRQDAVDRAKKHEQSLIDTLADLQTRSRQHPEGTVAELATKLGVYKSEVRRLKANGQLEQRLSEYRDQVTAALNQQRGTLL